MVDTTLDALLEAVRFLAEHVRLDAYEKPKLESIVKKLDALIAQRKGRPDDEPAG